MSLPAPNQRQARLIWMALTGLAIAILIGLAVALLWGLSRVMQILSPVLWPLAIAGIIACLLDPAVDLIERKGATRPRAIAAVFGIALLVVTALFGSIVPQIVNETGQLADRIPAYAARLTERVEFWMSHPPPWVQKLIERESNPSATPARGATTNESVPLLTTNGSPANPVAQPAPEQGLLEAALGTGKLETAAGWLAGVLRRTGVWLFGHVASWFGILAGLALIPVYTFYFLLEKRGISSRWTDYLPVSDSSFKTELVFILNSINNYLIAFFRGQVLVAICDGILYCFGFLIIGLPYALLIGASAIVLTIIPFLGAIIICLTALMIAIVQYGDWLHPLLVLAVFAVVQTLEGLVISPKIMGGRVGLHPVTIIIAVMAGTTLLGGLLGGMLAIPLTAALRVVMFRYVWKRSKGANVE
jgi:predicted PurR-regulated permease PerM